MINNELTDITVVLDRSGSMSSVRKDTIGGFNTFLEEQKAVEGTAKLIMVQFDHEIAKTVDAVDVRDVKPLTAAAYVPRGNTALLDAIGRSVIETGERLAKLPDAERHGAVVFAIITDGAENCSREYTRAKVFELITEQREKYNWQFLFLGANQDAIAVGAQYGIQAGNAATYQSDHVGAHNAFVGISRGVSSYRSSTRGGQSIGYAALDDAEVQAIITSTSKVDADADASK